MPCLCLVGIPTREIGRRKRGLKRKDPNANTLISARPSPEPKAGPHTRKHKAPPPKSGVLSLFSLGNCSLAFGPTADAADARSTNAGSSEFREILALVIASSGKKEVVPLRGLELATRAMSGWFSNCA